VPPLPPLGDAHSIREEAEVPATFSVLTMIDI